MTQIRTTHTGSLPRPEKLVDDLLAREQGKPAPGLAEATRIAVRDVVARQVETGLDLVNDGEQGKAGYSTYVRHRLTGFDGEPRRTRFTPDYERFPDFGDLATTLSPARPLNPSCSGPIRRQDSVAVLNDIADLKSAARELGVGEDRLFMTAASPGVIALFFATDYYRTREEYLAALVDAMREEYRAIVDAGILLQLDCPDFAMARHTSGPAPMEISEFRDYVELSVDALNAAVEGFDPARIRIHLCWSNTESPHLFDVELRDIIDIALRALPAGIVLEASNPRHAHEWKIFEDVELPEGKYLVPGVIDTTTNFVEHPELVAQRILNYTGLLGAERVVAGTDCGFGTFAGRQRVATTVAWEKLRSLVHGAAIASRSS